MPSLQILPSHHEGRVVLRVPLLVHRDGLYQMIVVPLLQPDRRPEACDTGNKKRRGKSTETKSSTRGPTTPKPSLSGADDDSADEPMPPRRRKRLCLAGGGQCDRIRRSGRSERVG